MTDDQDAREALRRIFEEPDMTLAERAAYWRCEARRLRVEASRLRRVACASVRRVTLWEPRGLGSLCCMGAALALLYAL